MLWSGVVTTIGRFSASNVVLVLNVPPSIAGATAASNAAESNFAFGLVGMTASTVPHPNERLYSRARRRAVCARFPWKS